MFRESAFVYYQYTLIEWELETHYNIENSLTSEDDATLSLQQNLQSSRLRNTLPDLCRSGRTHRYRVLGENYHPGSSGRFGPCSEAETRNRIQVLWLNRHINRTTLTKHRPPTILTVPAIIIAEMSAETLRKSVTVNIGTQQLIIEGPPWICPMKNSRCVNLKIDTAIDLVTHCKVHALNTTASKAVPGLWNDLKLHCNHICQQICPRHWYQCKQMLYTSNQSVMFLTQSPKVVESLLHIYPYSPSSRIANQQ